MPALPDIPNQLLLQPDQQPAGSNAWNDTYRWLLGWSVALVLLALLNRTRLGHVFIYYWLVLLIVFLVVTQYQFVIDALGPLGTPAPGEKGGQA